jgi:hypothetical protein
MIYEVTQPTGIVPAVLPASRTFPPDVCPQIDTLCHLLTHIRRKRPFRCQTSGNYACRLLCFMECLL